MQAREEEEKALVEGVETSLEYAFRTGSWVETTSLDNDRPLSMTSIDEDLLYILCNSTKFCSRRCRR